MLGNILSAILLLVMVGIGFVAGYISGIKRKQNYLIDLFNLKK